MDSKIDIVNKSLGLLGTEFITSLTEDTKPARFANKFYESSRDAVFRAHPWNCCIKRASLSLLSTTPAYYFDYEFQLPGDFIRIILPEDDTIEYKIEGDKLLTTTTTFKTTYVFVNDTVGQYDALLKETIAARLAADVAMPLVQDLQVVEAMTSLYDKKLAEARSVDAMEGTPEGIDSDFWLESRVTGTNLRDYRWNRYTT